MARWLRVAICVQIVLGPVAPAFAAAADGAGGANRSTGEAPPTPPPPAEIIEYYGYDSIGSARVAVAPDGTVLSRVDYLPCGEVLAATAAMAEGFVGKPRDAETDLDYSVARMYRAQTGRFISPDPVLPGPTTDPQRWNRYSYALNNPLSFTDPDGRLVPFMIFEDWILGMLASYGWGFSDSVVVTAPVLYIPTVYFPPPPAVGDNFGDGGGRGGGGTGSPAPAPGPSGGESTPSTGGGSPAPPPTPPTGNPCDDMAKNAQIAADYAIRLYGSDSQAALQTFDRVFSDWYVGQQIRNVGAGITAFSKGRIGLPLGTLHGRYRGQSDFKPEFQEQVRWDEDQTHHLATYLSTGMNATAGSLLDYGRRFHEWRDNKPDRRLGEYAFQLGQRLAQNSTKLSNVGAEVSAFCK